MSVRKVGVLVSGALMIWAALALPAGAHVQVEAVPGAPGAVDAVLKITAAAESATSGIAKLDVVADPAIGADQVTLVDGPAGWKITPGTQTGFALEGPALPKGEDAKVSVRVKTLPNAPQVVFKVLQSYSDGEVERWIELPGPDGQEPDKPAPIVKLAAGAQSAISPEPTNDNDEATHGAEAHNGNLARTGSAARALTSIAGLLLLGGGWSLMAGTGSRSRRRLRTG
jgi:uncharacterized protein DUF1775